MTRDLDKCYPVCMYPLTHRHYHPMLERSHNPMTADIGEHSPLWANLDSLFPDWAALKAKQKKRDDERIKKDREKRAALAKKQLQKDKGIAAADKKSGGIYRTKDVW